MYSPRSRLGWFVGLLASIVAGACGDGEHLVGADAGGGNGGNGDSGGNGGSGGSGGSGGGSSDPVNSANTTQGGTGGGAQGGSGGTAGIGGGGAAGMDAGGSGGALAGCGEASVDALADGSWDPRFTIAGVTGHDGITPIVYDFALDPDGGVFATGRFAYHERNAVPPLLRLEDGQWRPARESWTLEVPGDGFAALAASEDGVLALATADSFGERDGEIWVDRDGQQESIGAFTGQVRSLAWFGEELYAAGYFQLAEDLGAVENLAVWDGESWSGPPLGDADGPVLELLVSDGSLYVGGSFTSVGG